LTREVRLRGVSQPADSNMEPILAGSHIYTATEGVIILFWQPENYRPLIPFYQHTRSTLSSDFEGGFVFLWQCSIEKLR